MKNFNDYKNLCNKIIAGKLDNIKNPSTKFNSLKAIVSSAIRPAMIESLDFELNYNSMEAPNHKRGLLATFDRLNGTILSARTTILSTDSKLGLNKTEVNAINKLSESITEINSIGSDLIYTFGGNDYKNLSEFRKLCDTAINNIPSGDNDSKAYSKLSQEFASSVGDASTCTQGYCKRSFSEAIDTLDILTESYKEENLGLDLTKNEMALVIENGKKAQQIVVVANKLSTLNLG